MTDISPRLDLPCPQPAQAQNHVTHNKALRVLDVLAQLTVVAFDATTPPSLPVEGAVYALGAGADGDWTGHDNELAVSVHGVWRSHVPQAGWTATLAESNSARIWSGSEWDDVLPDAFDNLEHLGIGAWIQGVRP